MKIAMTRFFNTRDLFNQLPEVFTRKEYDALREAQIDRLMEEDSSKSHYWRNVISREKAAFTLANLRKEDCLEVVRSEPVTIETEKWNYKTQTYEKKSIEVERYYYRFKEEIKKLFS